MQTTVKYNVDSITRTFTTTPTFAQLVADQTIKMALGYGDNVRALVNGIEQPANNLVPDGVEVRIETRANSKASHCITIRVGDSIINKTVEDDFTAEEVLDYCDQADLIDSDTAYVAKVNGQILSDDATIPTASTVMIEQAPVAPASSGVATCAYGTESYNHPLASGETFGQLCVNPTIKMALGFGDNVRPLVNGIEQAATTVVPNGVTVRFETRANSKA